MLTCRRIPLADRSDSRGNLLIAECGKEIPFSVERAFMISGVPSGQQRGGHSHREQQQFLVMVSGSCMLTADDGHRREREPIQGPAEGVYVPSGVWLELAEFSPDAICLVFASGHFDEADYIRDFEEFKRSAHDQ